jgi:hypothetical protein
MDHHCPWLDNCAGHLTIKAFLLFCIYIGIFCSLVLYHATQMCWPKFNSSGHGLTSILTIWTNRLSLKFWKLDIWFDVWGIFDTFFFGLNSIGVAIGFTTFVQQMKNQARHASTIDQLKGAIRPYRGYRNAFKDVWNTKETCFWTWLLPTNAYSSFKIDRLAPELAIIRKP